MWANKLIIIPVRGERKCLGGVSFFFSPPGLLPLPPSSPSFLHCQYTNNVSVCVYVSTSVRVRRARAPTHELRVSRFFFFSTFLRLFSVPYRARGQTMGVRRWIIPSVDKVRVEHALSVAFESENGRCFWKTKWLKREFVELWSLFLFFNPEVLDTLKDCWKFSRR